MKNFKRILSVALCTALVAGMLGGCGKKVDKDSYVARTREEASEESEAALESSNESGTVSAADWTTMQFTIDGNELTFNRMPYTTLESLGMSFEPAIYGMDNLSAEKGVFYERSVYLNHPNYDDASVVVGFTNFEDEPCGLDKISLWSIEFVSKDKTAYPAITLPGGITWGNDEATVKSAYGEPTSVERNDAEGFTKLTYSNDSGKAILLNIYDDTGIGRITFEAFS